MTRRDINVLTFLRQAIEHKLKNPDDIDFNSIRYEKGAIHGGIFNWFKDTLKTFSQTGYPELNLKPDEVRLGLYRYFNIEDPNVQKLFIAELSRLPVLLPFYRPESLLDKKDTGLPDSLHAEIKKDVEAEKSIYDASAKAPLTEAPVGEPAKKDDKKTKLTPEEIQRALAEEVRLKKASEKFVQEEKPETMTSGKESGTGTGTAATNKITQPEATQKPAPQESNPKEPVITRTLEKPVPATRQPVTRQVTSGQRQREIRKEDRIPEGTYGQTGSLQKARQVEEEKVHKDILQGRYDPKEILKQRTKQPTQTSTAQIPVSQKFEPVPPPRSSPSSGKSSGFPIFSRIRLPDSFKNAFSNLASKARIGFNRLIGSKIGPGLVSGGLGALGGALLGPSLGANSSIGAAVGGGLGAAAPGFMESGGGNKILSAGNNIANSISNLTGGMARRKASLKSKTSFLRRRAAVMFFLMFMGTAFFMVGFGGGGSGNNSSTPTSRAGGGNTGGASANCQAGWPTTGQITQGPSGAVSHKNILPNQSVDIGNSTGTPIYATFQGTIQETCDFEANGNCKGSYGNYVKLKPAGQNSTVLFAHLTSFNVTQNTQVQPGQQIGTMGSTGRSSGPHLHYEFQGLPLAPPNIPGAITPSNCDPDFNIACKPPSVQGCSNSNSTGNNASCQISGNLIQNCGFENSLTGWTNTATIKSTQFSDNLSFSTSGHTGNSAVLIGGESASLCQAPKNWDGGDPTPGSFRIFPEVRQYIESSNMNSSLSIEFWFKMKSEGTYQVGTNRAAPFYIYIANEEAPPYPGKEIFVAYSTDVPSFDQCGKGNFSSSYNCIINGGSAFDCSDAFSQWKKVNINLSSEELEQIGIKGKRVYIGFGVTNDFPTAVYLDDVKITSGQGANAQISTPDESKYWLLLHRASKKEELWQGIPGDKNNSKRKEVFDVNPGIPGERPTPLPSKLGKEYFTIKTKRETYPEEKNKLEMGNYFLIFDIGLSKEELQKDPFGPSPYNECGADKNSQCNWETPGDFGMHGISGVETKLTDAGSSGCVRHSDSNMDDLYLLLKDVDYEIRYYIEDN